MLLPEKPTAMYVAENHANAQKLVLLLYRRQITFKKSSNSQSKEKVCKQTKCTQRVLTVTIHFAHIKGTDGAYTVVQPNFPQQRQEVHNQCLNCTYDLIK